MSRIIVLFSVAVIATTAMLAQNTIFVRTAGNDASNGSSEGSAKKTLAAALAAASSGDIIDIGPGSFAGGPISKGVVIQGANANNALSLWDTPTIITSTLTLDEKAAGTVLTLVGLQFGQIVPLAGRCENANLTIYNCKFNASKPITTTGSSWAELFLTASQFEGRPEGAKPGAPLAPLAIKGGDVGITVIRENIFRNYGSSAVDVSGGGQILRLSFNEYVNCNASPAADMAAVRVDATKIEQELTIENSVFASNATSVVVSGAIAGKTVVVQRNSFRQTPAGSVALKNLAASTLDATCNAFNVATKDKDKALDAKVISASVRKLVSGAVTISPTNLDATDTNGDSIGFEPDASKGCAGSIVD
ncbi:MAG: hypothetical protein FGM32_04310 [Candidatus Kapabacteria bacterium]|nr:hypothetical protein [Candidatus Kapabacteria bacterium]